MSLFTETWRICPTLRMDHARMVIGTCIWQALPVKAKNLVSGHHYIYREDEEHSGIRQHE
jgi:hypothetical protein